MKKITLILNRSADKLEIYWSGRYIGTLDEVTGVRQVPTFFKCVKILRRGKRIAFIWHVDEIKERW